MRRTFWLSNVLLVGPGRTKAVVIVKNQMTNTPICRISAPSKALQQPNHLDMYIPTRMVLLASLKSGRGTVTTSKAAIPPPNDILLDFVTEFRAFICMEPFHDGSSATTIIVYFVGVLTTGQDAVMFERSRNYTLNLSEIIHSASFCLLEATLPRFPHLNLNWEPRSSLGQDIVLNQMREAFLCQGSAAPVSEIFSLRIYGGILTRTDGPAFRVDWTEDGGSVKWEDGSLTMTGFCALGHHTLDLV
jgi:hypothetical protein